MVIAYCDMKGSLLSITKVIVHSHSPVLQLGGGGRSARRHASRSLNSDLALKPQNPFGTPELSASFFGATKNSNHLGPAS